MTQDERNAAIKRHIRRIHNKLMRSPEDARAYLIERGFYNADGTLHRDYGGKNDK